MKSRGIVVTSTVVLSVLVLVLWGVANREPAALPQNQLSDSREISALAEGGPASESAATRSPDVNAESGYDDRQSVTTRRPVTLTPLMDYAPGATEIYSHVAASDIIMLGLVTEVEPGRWNSADGREWTTKDETDIPAIYRVFYVEPKVILKGIPQFGTPVAFMTMGGTEGVVDGPVRVGDEVLVFGYIEEGLFGDVQWKEDAYWTRLTSELGIYLRVGSELRSLAEPDNPRFGRTTLEEIRVLLGRAK